MSAGGEGVAFARVSVCRPGLTSRRGGWSSMLVPCVIAGAAAVFALFAGSGARAGRLAAPPGGGEAGLPLAAEGPVSAALGRNLPAYRVVRLGAGNPAQGLVAGFSRSGVTISSGGWRLGIGLSKWGHGSVLRRVGSVAPRVNGNRVSYAYGPLTGWWTNGPLGFEQGFDIPAPPDTGHGPLTLSLRLSGGLMARMEHGSVRLSGRGVALSYGGLVVGDARGRAPHSWLELVRGGVQIRVDDRGAVYPLRIDPFVQQAQLTAANGAEDDRLGVSVAVSGGTIAAGAPFHWVGKVPYQGEVYVFVKPRSGWANATESARLTSSNGAANNSFGSAVAISGDTIVAASSIHTTLGERLHQGEVYVFERPKSGWANATENARLTASDGIAEDYFGYSLAVSGDTIVAGTPFHTVGKHISQGEAYVFVRSKSGWAGAHTQNARLTASNGAAGDNFGVSVAVAGDTIVVGGNQHKVGKHAGQGEAYVFVRPKSGWAGRRTETARLTASHGATGDSLGFSVAASGDTIVAGAHFHNAGKHSEKGAAYVFVRPRSGWAGSRTETARLTASNGATRDQFGWSVAASGDTIVAGAPFHKVGRHAGQGEAYVFVRPKSGWAGRRTETARLTASHGATGDDLAYSVAASSKTIVAGALGRHHIQGEVYVFQETRTCPDRVCA
jgi:hypothetical protein